MRGDLQVFDQIFATIDVRALVVPMYHIAMRLRSTFLWTMIVSLALSAAFGVIAILFETSFGTTSERVLATSLLVSAFSLTALAASIVLDQHRCRAISWAGIATSMLALANWLIMIWADPWIRGDLEDALWKIGGTFTVAAIWCPHVGLLSLLRFDEPIHRGVRRATWAIASALGLMIVAVMWTEEFEDWTGKTIAILAILTACGTAVTPVLAIIERVRRKDRGESVERRVEIDLSCPRCGTAQRLKAGTAHCRECGLKISVDVEEPRCACGYLLYQLTGDTCPECGKTIDPNRVWSPKRDLDAEVSG